MSLRIAIDFDGTLVAQDHPHDDLDTPLTFIPGAKEALASFKAAGHYLILWSGRSNLSLRKDWRLNPRNVFAHSAGKFSLERWEKNQILNEARYQQMLDFVQRELLGYFDEIDDGCQGKISADLYIDDRVLTLGGELGYTWPELQDILGEKDATPQDL